MSTSKITSIPCEAMIHRQSSILIWMVSQIFIAFVYFRCKITVQVNTQYRVRQSQARNHNPNMATTAIATKINSSLWHLICVCVCLYFECDLQYILVQLVQHTMSTICTHQNTMHVHCTMYSTDHFWSLYITTALYFAIGLLLLLLVPLQELLLLL